MIALPKQRPQDGHNIEQEHGKKEEAEPHSPTFKALGHGRERRFGLEVYLTDPDVPIDTNHLERALRAVPMGRKIGCFAGLNVCVRPRHLERLGIGG